MEAESPHTLVFYESPYRLIAFLNNCLEILGDRQAVVANDLTRSSSATIAERFLKLLKNSPPIE